MASALPASDTILVEFEFELITWDESDIVTLIWEHEISNALVRQTTFPADTDVPLSLRLFELSIVIGFEFDERLEDLFVLLGVSVAEEDGLLLLLDSNLVL